jgi:hypothetical protein
MAEADVVDEVLRLAPEVAEELGFYVYLYIDPRTEKPFYVGKGQGGRALAHVNVQGESRKARILAELKEKSLKPRIDILCHKLADAQTALHVEAAIIDALELGELTNEVRGWRTSMHGRAPLSELAVMYGARPVTVDDPSLLIRINRLFTTTMDPHSLYEATRGSWRLGPSRSEARYAMAVFNGVVRAVYEIQEWHPGGTTAYTTRDTSRMARPGRWEFVGREAPPEILAKYLGRKVTDYVPRGLQSPVVYVNCGRRRRRAGKTL